jgi:hypothetical protein
LTRRNQWWLHRPAAKLPPQDVTQTMLRMRIAVGVFFPALHEASFFIGPTLIES